MLRFPFLWLATIGVLAGALPAVGMAQVKLHLTDDQTAANESIADTADTDSAIAPASASDFGLNNKPAFAGKFASKIQSTGEENSVHFADDQPSRGALSSFAQETPPRVGPSASDPVTRSLTDTEAPDASEYWMIDDGGYAARNWFEADYLVWWTSGNAVPALVTSSPAGTAQVNAGVLGVPTTSILFGNGDIDGGDRSGMRFTVGHWADEDNTVGLQATYFSVFDDTSSGDFSARTAGAFGAGTGAPILARPFFNVDALVNANDARLISFPNIVDGGIAISSDSEMHSINVMLRQHFRSGSRGRLDLIGGYRYFRFREHLLIQESLTSTDPGGLFPIGTTFLTEDAFEASNDFHGGDMGVQVEFWRGYWTIEVLAKVALGNLHRTSKVTGGSFVNAGAGTVATPGGLLAQPTNMGSFTSNDFAALPELNLNAKFEPFDNFSVQIGYSLLLLNDVARTGDLIDPAVNATQLFGGGLVGAARPASQFANTSDLWAQGINFGVTFRR